MVDIFRKLRTRVFYQTDAEGVFVGEVSGHESPLEPGVFLVPAGAVNIRPPKMADGERARWDAAQGWSVEAIPAPEPVEVSAGENAPAFSVRWDAVLGVWVADGLPAPGA